MTKSFKIARKPGQPAQDADGKPRTARPATPAASKGARPKRGSGAQTTAPPAAAPLGSGPTTRKTIEVPEDYFYMVKMRALQRQMKEKDLWAEILRDYFRNNADM